MTTTITERVPYTVKISVVVNVNPLSFKNDISL